MHPINKRINKIAVEIYKDNNSAFAKAMETSEANIRNYRATTVPKLDFITKLAEKLEISFDFLLKRDLEDIPVLFHEPEKIYKLKGEKTFNGQQVPLYDIEASAGMVELFRKDNGKNKPIDFISIPNLPKCDGAIYVTGDSMYPLLKSGDIVMYKKLGNSMDNIFFGEMYLISLDLDGEEYISVKWIQKSEKGDEHIKLVSENRHHQPKDVHLSKVKALALIKGSIRINSMN